MGDGGRAALLGAACVLGAFVLYAGALGHPFLGDDRLAVRQNPTVAQPSVTGFGALWVTDYWRGVAPDGLVTEMSTDRNLYRPVTIASFWLTSWVAGLEPAAFRSVNVAWHGVAAALVGLVCAALGWPRGSVVAALLVLVHPVATDVVNRIVGLADVLTVVGVTAFLLVQHGAARTGWTAGRCLGAFLAASVALGAKESGVVLVPLAVLQHWLMRGAGVALPTRSWRAWAPLGAAVALYVAGRAVAVGLPEYAPSPTWDLGGNPVWGVALADRLPVAAALAWHYASLVVWPAPLIAFDVPARLPSFGDAQPWLGLIVLAGAAIALLRALRGRHAVSIGLAWWLLSFVIVSQLVTPIGAYREVRFAYALVAATALGVGWIAERAAASVPAVRWGGTVGALVLVVLAGAASWQRTADYRDLRALLEADVRQRPASPAALIRLANIHERAHRHDEAEGLYERVLVLAPRSAQARYELADFSARRGQQARARTLHEEAVALNPAHYLSLMALGTMALKERDLVAAQAYLDRAVAVAPEDPWVIYNFAVVENARGERASALARLTALVERRPDFSLAVRGLEKLRASEAQRRRRPPGYR